jgi:hypothetical protein
MSLARREGNRSAVGKLRTTPLNPGTIWTVLFLSPHVIWASGRSWVSGEPLGCLCSHSVSSSFCFGSEGDQGQAVVPTDSLPPPGTCFQLGSPSAVTHKPQASHLDTSSREHWGCSGPHSSAVPQGPQVPSPGQPLSMGTPCQMSLPTPPEARGCQASLCTYTDSTGPRGG